ncbi:MAG: hypothetical protein K2Y37_26710 [Pirellulales bacterium]|nr:hypothetical protein [Pirellulales bacterium]
MVVGIYMYGRIAWLELKIVDKTQGMRQLSQELGISEYTAVIGPMRWRSLGLSETSIDTWSTACWIDDALHLVSDDGQYERFIIKDDKVVRAGQLKDLGAPAAICQGKSHLWVLTEKENEPVAVQEITWNQEGQPAKTQLDLGRITLDQAAVKVLAAEAN